MKLPTRRGPLAYFGMARDDRSPGRGNNIRGVEIALRGLQRVAGQQGHGVVAGGELAGLLHQRVAVALELAVVVRHRGVERQEDLIGKVIALRRRQRAEIQQRRQ